MINLTDLETTIAGMYLALVVALGPEVRALANETLLSLRDDPRTSEYAAKFFDDVAQCAESVTPGASRR